MVIRCKISGKARELRLVWVLLIINLFNLFVLVCAVQCPVKLCLCPAAWQDFQHTPYPVALVFSWFPVDTDQKTWIFVCFVVQITKMLRKIVSNSAFEELEYQGAAVAFWARFSPYSVFDSTVFCFLQVNLYTISDSSSATLFRSPRNCLIWPWIR